MRLVEHFFNSKFPADWDLKYDDSGEIVYFKDDLVIEDYPTLYLCKERLLARSFEQASPKDSIKSSQSIKSLKSEKKSNSNRKSSIDKNSSTSSQKHKEIESTGKKSEKEEGLKEIKIQCQKLAHFATQSIEFYMKNQQFDSENHYLLVNRIQDFRDKCNGQLENELSSYERKFFSQWSKKFAVLLIKMREIEESFKVSINED
jgi:hypothetical protein